MSILATDNKVLAVHLRTIKMTFLKHVSAIVLCSLSVIVLAQPQEFHRDSALNISPGTLINAANIDAFSDNMDEAVATFVKNGDTEILVGAPIKIDIHPNYVEATPKNTSTVKLGKETGDLEGYITGRPFPGIPSLDDPRAGEKTVWNMRYSYAPDESETELMTWLYKNMSSDSPERSLQMYGSIMRFTHRHTSLQRPELSSNPQDLFSALYLWVKYPQDVRNTQLLTYTKNQDSDTEQAFIYLNTQRRVRRISPGQKTDAFLGSDIMIEDFLGYNGRIRDQVWEFLGEKDILAPVYAYNDLPASSKEVSGDFEVLGFNGAGQCFPSITWQPRKVYLLKATPKEPGHPLSHRIFSIDASTFTPLLTRIYDRAGKLWKLGMVAISNSANHLPENAAWQGAITDAVSMIDIQARHCTTIQFRTKLPDKGLKPQMFTTQQMRSAGR